MESITLDIELLQLPETSPMSMKSNQDFVKKLFDQWLALPETNRLVTSLVNDAKAGVALNVMCGGGSSGTNSGSNSPLASMFPARNGPPLSPRNSTGSPRIARQRTGLSNLSSPLKVVSDHVKELIPQFYFEDGRPPPNDLKEQCIAKINSLFYGHEDGLQLQEFKLVTTEICKVPSFFSTSIFKKVDTNNTGFVKREDFIDYWVKGNMLTKEITSQVFTILKQPDHNYLVQDDFKPVLQELLATHPGLEFLQGTPEFQDRYG
jgi:serine/threonine-protein phosphatase 2A regulatory subunit B''